MINFKSFVLAGLLLIGAAFNSMAAAGCSFLAYPKKIVDGAGNTYAPTTFYVVHNNVPTYWNGDYNNSLVLQNGDYLWISYPSTVCNLAFSPNVSVVSLTTSCKGTIGQGTLRLSVGSSGGNTGFYEASWWIQEDCNNCIFNATAAAVIPCSGEGNKGFHFNDYAV